jgi:hypothetical protein
MLTPTRLMSEDARARYASPRCSRRFAMCWLSIAAAGGWSSTRLEQTPTLTSAAFAGTVGAFAAQPISLGGARRIRDRS